MAQSDYIYIRDEDWIELNRTFRRLNERVSQLEGAGAMSHKYSNTDMRGNKITDGPAKQSRADDQEFITKDYLRSKEVADIVSRAIGSGGLSPIILSPSQPGASSLGGPVTLPDDMIYGGGAGSEMTDFTIENGLWVPVYNPGGPSLDLSGGLCRTYSATAATTTVQQFFAGVRSKFSIFPDENGDIEFRFTISNFSYSNISDSNHGPFGVGCLWSNSYFNGLSASFATGAWLSVNGQVDYSNWIAGQSYISTAAYNQPLVYGTYNPSPTLLGTSPGGGEFRIVISKTHVQTYKYSIVTNVYFRKVDSDPWVDYVRSNLPTTTRWANSGILGDICGLGIFLGGMGYRPGTLDSTISKFVIDKGLAVIGQQSDAYAPS